jgi:hypothetical protein
MPPFLLPPLSNEVKEGKTKGLDVPEFLFLILIISFI